MSRTGAGEAPPEDLQWKTRDLYPRETILLKVFAIACAVAGVAGLGACEKAGEEIDSALEKADGGPKDLRDGPFEKAGEAVDNTIGVKRDNDADSLADAVDGDKATKPN